MAAINPLFKKIFVFFNCIFAICGIALISLGLYLQQYIDGIHGLQGVFYLYVLGSIIFLLSVLGAYGTYKENKCALIVFCVLMGLATAGMLRLAIPLAVSHQLVISTIRESFQSMLPLTENNDFLDTFQTHFHCCGLVNGYKDWQEVPESCNCVNGTVDECERIPTENQNENVWLKNTRKVWSKPCGPVIIQYVDEVLYIVIAVLFSLAVLALLGCLMSFAMVLRIRTTAAAQMPPLPLPYHPPKYTQLINN